MIIAWGSNLFGLGYGGLSWKACGRVHQFRLLGADPAIGHVFSGFEFSA
jgi:AGZA family xanthine/uracil permease-like MFS transporter